ncbi:MAG: rhomboid family intramembrane serine protease [Verrucomicrobiota bacterium]|nr:rhomboid family intramembrane serine protease [Verrucomicrobiota bacterium]
MFPLYDNQPTRRFPFVTLLIIAVNVFVFVGWQLQVGLPRSVQLAAMVPAEFTHSPSPDSVFHMVASMFMHGGWMHLIGNMWFLWIFGNNIEDATGPTRYAVFYFLSGVAADLAFIAFSPNSMTPLIGASGAVSGVLGAYLLLHPRASVMTLVPLGFYARIIPLPAFLFLIIWIFLQIILQAASGGHKEGGGVAYLAHIGGFLFGLLLIMFFKRRDA